jgi:hypothetical protein
VNGTIQPIVEERQKAQEAAERQRLTAAAVEEGRTVIKDGIAHARTLPFFKDNEMEVSKKLGEIPPEVRSKVGLVGAMYMAYAAVLASLVGKATTQGAENTLTDLKRKANAGGGNAVPGGPVPGETKERPQNVGALAKHMEKLAATLTVP